MTKFLTIYLFGAAVYFVWNSALWILNYLDWKDYGLKTFLEDAQQSLKNLLFTPVWPLVLLQILVTAIRNTIKGER